MGHRAAPRDISKPTDTIGGFGCYAAAAVACSPNGNADLHGCANPVDGANAGADGGIGGHPQRKQFAAHTGASRSAACGKIATKSDDFDILILSAGGYNRGHYRSCRATAIRTVPGAIGGTRSGFLNGKRIKS